MRNSKEIKKICKDKKVNKIQKAKPASKKVVAKKVVDKKVVAKKVVAKVTK